MTSALRPRLIISLVIAITSALACYYAQVTLRGFPNAGDITWPLNAARDLLSGGDPYATGRPTLSHQWPTNPLTTVLVLLPLTPLPDGLAGPLFFGLSSGLLAYGLTRDGYWRLLTFVSYPYWVALMFIQWSPLLLSVLFLPALLPLTLAKPQLGIPVALTRATWVRMLVCAAFLAVSLIIMPAWPLRWREQVSMYDGVIPLRIFPGPLILLALIAWRSERARFLVLMACMPQRMFYDQLALWWLPQSLRGMAALTAAGWIGRWLLVGMAWPSMVLFSLYLPALMIVLQPEVTRLWRRRQLAAQPALAARAPE